MLKVEDESDFERDRAYLQKQRAEMEEGKATFHTLEEFEAELDKVIQKYEK